MDDQVLAAMRKWPDVPAVRGWLRLGRRGTWFLIDRGRPDFEPQRDGAGSPITSPPILDFIARNYGQDDQGAWYWQNGPQRVYVELELAPLVLRVLNEAPMHRLVTHTGKLVERIDRVASDADGNLLLATDLGAAVIDDRDIGQLVLEPADAGEETHDLLLVLDTLPGPSRLPDGRPAWPVRPLAVRGPEAIGQAFGFVARP